MVIRSRLAAAMLVALGASAAAVVLAAAPTVVPNVATPANWTTPSSAPAVAGAAADGPTAPVEWTPTRAFRIFSKASYRGLPQSSVMALAQDEEGLLWIGTLDGAATFDGRTIEPVAAVPAAPLRGVISSIVARRGGGVFVGSAAGVHVFDGRSWRLLPSAHGVGALAQATDGTLWMSDSLGALWSLPARALAAAAGAPPSAEPAWRRHTQVGEDAADIVAAPDGALWVATQYGALRLEGERVQRVGGAPLPARPGAILVARDGRVWVATQGCSVHWTRGGVDGWHQVELQRWPRGAFRALAEDRRGRVWATSSGGGVAFGRADGKPWTVWHAANGPFAGGAPTALGDREGSVWFGLNALGIAQWTGEEWSHLTSVDPATPGAELFSAFGLARGSTPGTLLVGAFNAGVIQLTPQGARHYGAAQGITEDVRAAVEPVPGDLVAGTRFGLFESKHGEPFHQIVRLANGFVMGFFRSPDTPTERGRWYAATSSQGVLVRDDAGAWAPDDAIDATLDNVHVRGMTWMQHGAQQGELWVATLRGITVLREGNPPEPRWRLVRRLEHDQVPAMPESVNSVLEVGPDEIWAGGTGGIAVRKGGRWHRLGESDGIPGQTIYSLARGKDGAIWVGGSGGVGRYRDGRWTVWDSRTGLLQEECNLDGLVVGDDGQVWVSMMGGLGHFDPSVRPLAPPPLHLFWRQTPPSGGRAEATLARGERALHLGWVAPWLGPHPVEYRVRVPRLRAEWSAPSADDHLDVENLGPGAWRVEVEGRVEGSAAWSAPLVLEARVLPYWYETLLAKIGLVALLALLGVVVVRLRLRALRKHAAALEQTVRVRTAELAETVEQLRESEQRALAASRAKSAFLANMSHELRTPLNGILGFAQLLSRRGPRDPEDRQGLQVILKSGEHLLGLINDVLSLSKIEAGRIALDESVFDLATLVRDTLDVLRFRAEEKKLVLACEMDEERLPRAVRGDEGRLRQILLNLLGNAVKFTAHGTVALRVSWRDGRARFAIADTGPGIERADLARLFEPFAQTELGQRMREGTGLGLALSRDLARLMGGDITVVSTPGVGSTFSVEVALADASERVVVVRERRRVAALAPGQGEIRVLVVDDLALNRAVLGQLLRAVGFQVREAASGGEAIALWREWQPHLVWMDKRMHDMDGLETTRRIRAEESASGRARVPILALSASALEHERSEILGAGCDDFVPKPYREATIFAKLGEFLGVKYVYEGEEAPALVATTAEGEPRATDAARPSGLPAEGSAEVAPVAAGAPSVLVVDDDWICREVARELLAGAGVSVSLAASGAEALAAIEGQAFDLVLLDLQMPGMDGVATARRLRERPHGAHVPIVAVTAEEDPNAQLAGAGVDDYLPKPIEPEALVALLRRWLPVRLAAR